MIVSRRSILVIIFLLLLACLFSACEKMDEDYIEVVDIRVSPSTIYLSPDGETSTYQIPEPTIIPHNATNRKVIYYASPEDLEYFSVDANGLVSAKKLTEDKKAFIRVSSSTNKTAYTLLTVIIENVDVEEISFAQREMKVQYTEDPFYVEPLFSPYHAQYGRDVVFSSSNPDVLTVDNEGLVTLNQVGIATVRAQAGSSLTSGKIVEGYIRIISGYAPGVYDLEVTSESPQFDQVVGEPSSISFNIPKGLYLSTDPKPDIKWYVGEIRDSKQDGEWSFKFEPDPNSNPTSFVVEARITPKGESTITLKSPLISLYRAFSGFSLYIHQPEGQVYHYGEEIALVPEEEEDNISDSYKWYMKEQGAKGLGK